MYPALFRHALFPAYETLTGRGTHRYLAEYRRNQWRDAGDIAQIQLDKLNALLDFCWHHVPYLGQRWRAAGLEPRRLACLRELEAYPVITKPEITANYHEMSSLPWRGRSMVKTTGGTTGDPFRFEYTMESYARRTAVMWRGYEWAGAGPGVRAALLWAKPAMPRGWRGIKERVYQRAFNRRFFDAFDMNEGNLAHYAAAITRYRPDVLVGYVRPVVQMARWINRSGRKIPGLRAVVTGAEALFAAERAEIEAAFACPVFNTYGCREFMLIAAECERHGGLHINADHLVVELVDTSGREVAGSPGDVVVTDLHNYAMPLVRYANGDRATSAPGIACDCGRGLPILQSVDGRILDMIVTTDGRYVPGEFFVHLLLGKTAIRRYQVVQVRPDRLEYRVVLNATLPAAERNQIVAETAEVVGPAMQVSVVEVDRIDEAASGKRRVTVSLDSYRAEQRS